MKKAVKFCPKCGSTNIGFGGPMGEMDVSREFCKDCEFGKFELGFINFPSKTKINDKNIKKETRKKFQKQ